MTPAINLIDTGQQTVAIASTEPALPDLEEGEASSIRLALSHNCPALLLIDERS